MEKKLVDATGLACPLPVVNAKKAADEMKEGGMLTVLADNETAVSNLSKFAASRQYEVSVEKRSDKEYAVTMLVKTAEDTASQSGECICEPCRTGTGVVAVISGNVMGTGDEKLGKALIKAFIFALSKQDTLPSAIVFYNSGAFLTCEGSESIEDLKEMENEGVRIITCGTCLDFYGLKEKLAVGSVSNMYDIVETQEKASVIIRP